MDLIKVDLNVNDGKQTVNARDLHEFLESKQEFATWIKNRIEQFSFDQGTDFVKFDNFIKSDSRARTEYHLSLDMSKELSMLERNDKGKQARKYFIECEKRVKQNIPALPTTYKEALVALVAEVEKTEKLESDLKEAQPKIDFHDKIECSKNSINVGQFAKSLCKEGRNVGRNRVFVFMYNEGYLKKADEPYQLSLNSGWVEMKKYSYERKDGESYTQHQVMITGKGQTYFTRKMQELGYLETK